MTFTYSDKPNQLANLKELTELATTETDFNCHKDCIEILQIVVIQIKITKLNEVHQSGSKIERGKMEDIEWKK